MTHPRELVGKRVLHVTTSWHHHLDAEPSLLHAWLDVESLGPIRCHTSGDGTRLIRAAR